MRRIKIALMFLVGLGAVGNPAANPESGESESMAGAIEELARRYHQAGQFDGSVLVAHEGQLIYKGGFGEANR